MRIKYFIFIYVLNTSLCFSQDNPDIYKSKDFIVWGTQELMWKDFRGPVLSKDFDAGTYGGISYYKEKNGELFWFAYFSKDKSWHSGEKNYGLEHEKYHFDIVEIHTRKLRKAISENRLPMKDTKKLNEYINKIWAECELMQNAYDKETKHSKNKKRQIEWEKKINIELDNLKSFSDITVTEY